MRQFFTKRINLLISVTLVFALIFVLFTFIIPSIIFDRNLDMTKDNLQQLTYDYKTVTVEDVQSTERLYVYEEGESKLIVDGGTVDIVNAEIELHLIHWSHDQDVPEKFYEDDFQNKNYVYYIRILEEENYVIAFSDTSELIEFVDNFRTYSTVIVILLYVATLIFTSTYLSNLLIKKYSFYDPSSELHSRIAFLHNYDKKNLNEHQITYHNIYNINDIIQKTGYANINEFLLIIKQKLLKVFNFEDIYQVSDSEFILINEAVPTAHNHFSEAVNLRLDENIIPYELKVKTVIVDPDILASIDAKTLIHRIQYALHHSKNSNRDTTYVDKELLDSLNEELYYQSKLHDAIDQSQLVNYYQIKVNPATNKVIGAEALSRWIEEEKVVTPSKYIHLAEASGLIYNVDLISFENACKTVVSLDDKDMLPENFRLSTNVSPLTLKNLSIETIKNILKETKAHPERISIEVTESVSLEFDKIKGLLDELVDMGFHIEIDDFSAGNSSFTILPFIKANTVKLDMAILPNNVNSKNEVLIYDSLLSISKQLDMKIISEGVESKDQVDYLKTRGVDGIQGFYYSRPVPYDEFEKLLQQYR